MGLDIRYSLMPLTRNRRDMVLLGSEASEVVIGEEVGLVVRLVLVTRLNVGEVVEGLCVG